MATSSWDDSPGNRSEWCRLISLFAVATHLEAADFLRGAGGQERFYWAEPSTGERRLTIAGTGIAAEVRVAPTLEADEPSTNLPGYRFEEVESQARRLFADSYLQSVDRLNDLAATSEMNDHPARPRLFGGFAFRDDFVPDNTWSVFSPAQFFLPHFQLVHDGREAYLTINALVSANEDLVESLQALREALLTRLEATAVNLFPDIGQLSVRYPMSYAAWRQMIDLATTTIHTGTLEKVVLARVCEVKSDARIDVAWTLDYLNERYGDCYRFIFEPVPHHAFFGATPELLVCKEAERIETMALAGSTTRGRSLEEDGILAAQLLSSAKNRHEHQLVVNAVGRQLADLTAELVIPDVPSVLRLRNIQHLLTPIEGRLHNPATGILPLVRLLHPTPAMGGVPADQALAFLREAEPVPRGWYAAPIGWLDSRHDGAFAVAIRSAVTQHGRAWLYAGAGIVADSQPEHEWEETALKFRPMLGALGVEEAR